VVKNNILLAVLFRKTLFLPLEKKIHICSPPCNILYLSLIRLLITLHLTAIIVNLHSCNIIKISKRFPYHNQYFIQYSIGKIKKRKKLSSKRKNRLQNIRRRHKRYVVIERRSETGRIKNQDSQMLRNYN